MGVLVAVQLAEDPAAAVFVDGVLVAAVREAVAARHLPEAGFPSAALDLALLTAGVSLREVERVVATGLAAPSAAGRVRALLGALGARAAPPSDPVRVRSRPAERGPVARAGLAAALARARLGHAPVEIVEPERARMALRSGGSWGAALELASPGPAALTIGAARVAVPALRPPADPFWGPGFTEVEAFRALGNARLPREKLDDPAGWARARLAAGEPLVWARGRAAFLDTPLGPRLRLRPVAPGETPTPGLDPSFGPAVATLLRDPAGIPALTPLDVITAWRAGGGRWVLGDFGG